MFRKPSVRRNAETAESSELNECVLTCDLLMPLMNDPVPFLRSERGSKTVSRYVFRGNEANHCADQDVAQNRNENVRDHLSFAPEVARTFSESNVMHVL